ncbi:esterase-like activity of phytase family protein [Luteococcus japonicus]|uniref:Alkaline phosphatase n=1 Tax=Luteococcus japonicus LSP_Lj1 TaxID=1255658 RepID=A0A1R4ITX3_9ACTN|nr:esterase-like activity of phytase family protein [Luteococcus japonicus]SJN23302.1 Alkaline phosphatase [Luteococcus japonicus LSP_Lj1]
MSPLLHRGLGIAAVTALTCGMVAAPTGSLMVFDLTSSKLLREIDLGGQPDSIDISPDGEWAAIAVENQRDEEFTPEGLDEGALPQLPAGFPASIDLRGEVADWQVKRTELTGLQGMMAADDPEPEYVKFSPDGSQVPPTLQENNHVAIIDPRGQKVLNHFSAGTVTVDGVDTKKDGVIDPTGSITAPREPDSIGWVDGRPVATSNEGAWLGGTRGWTIFDSHDGKVTWDAGNSLEQQVIANGHWPEGRAAKKGVEPEGLAVAAFNGRRYAFVGSERANVVAVYDVTRPSKPRYLQMLPSTNGPEGLLPVPSRNLLVVSSEVEKAEKNIRATVQTYQFSRKAKTAYPQFTATDGIAWGALGALTADPKKPGRLWSATDAAYKDTSILGIDAKGSQGKGKKAIEGAKAPEKMLVETDAKGAVLREVKLPEGYAAKLGKQGIEGVTGTRDGKVLYVAMQREAKGEDVTRIARYDVTTGQWSFYGYQPQATKGWTQEKLEGMTVDAHGDLYVVTDNDGVNDANGKTVLLNLVGP